MSDDFLPRYVKENHARTSPLDLDTWLEKNPLPAICEPKYEGMRVFLFKSGDHLVVSGGIGIVFTPDSTPSVFAKVTELVHAPNRMILDGVYVAREGLHLFDVLQLDDRDMRPLPLYRRKEIFHRTVLDSGLEVPFEWAESEEEIQRYAAGAFERGGEGVMVKKRNSFYGESESWIGIKKFDSADCFVIDFRDLPEQGRVWSLGIYDSSDKVVTLGEVASLSDRVDPKRVRLGSVVEVRYDLVDGKFLPHFVIRLRRDKRPSECRIAQIPRLEKFLLP